MAHELTVDRTAAARPELLRNAELGGDEVRQARIDLAACFRMAARLGFSEGICNHFSALVPGCSDLFLVNPIGMAFEEIGADDLLICDFDGNVVRGRGQPEATAFYIHARIHKQVPRATAAFHAHMPYATALAMVEGPPFSWAIQSSLIFYGRTSVYEEYNGLALDESEGDNIAASMKVADIVFMRNHGVLVGAPSIAEAWDDLYYLERAAQAEVIAASTGRRLIPVDPAIAEATARQIAEGKAESARLHLDYVKRAVGTR